MSHETDTVSQSAAAATESPSDRRRQRVRDLIIDGAEALFAEHGQEGLTIRRIAEKIDYSAGAIYQYFRSKEEILQAIRELFFERLLVRLNEVTDGKPMSVERVHLALRAYIDCGLEQPNHYRMAFSEGAKKPLDDKEEAVKTKMYQAAIRLEEVIACAVDAGVIPPTDAKLAATCVWPCLHGLTLIMVELEEFPCGLPGYERLSREGVTEYQVGLLVRGLGALSPDAVLLPVHAKP